MEHIQEFEIHVDISDRKSLYDYVTCQKITKPRDGKGWNLAELRKYGQVVDHFREEDENAMVRVVLMDKAIMDKKDLERRKKEKRQGRRAERSASVSSDDDDDDEKEPLVFDHRAETEGPPRRVLPIFVPGEVVKGNLVLKLKNNLEANRLTLRFDGHAVVNIRVYHRSGYYDYTKEEKFTENEVLLWKQTSKDTKDASGDLMSASGPMRSSTLEAGTHRFPFEFNIPSNAPQSCPPLIPHSADWAHLVYRLKASIHKDKLMKSGDISTYQGIWLETVCDIGRLKDAMQPVVVEETLDTGVIQFWKSGKLSVKVTLPQAGFLKGQDIPLMMEIDNQTKADIKKVKARIRMYGKARQGDGKLNLSHAINVKGEKVSEGPIATGMCPKLNWTLPWDFSECSVDGNLMPVGDLDCSVLLDINYEIDIDIKRSGLHRNMDIHIPIKVGNVNSRAARYRGPGGLVTDTSTRLYPTV